MKRSIYRVTILIPILMIFDTFMEPFAFCIPEIGLYLDSTISRFPIVMAIVGWLCCSQFPKSCCNGTWTELLFNLVPVELILIIVFAQWNFALFVIIILVLITCEIVFSFGFGRMKTNIKLRRKDTECD